MMCGRFSVYEKAAMKTRALGKMFREKPVGEKASHPHHERYHF
jgi:hypothetical protein